MANALQLSAQCPINRLSLLPQYVPTAFFGSLSRVSSSQTAAWQPRTQQTVRTPHFLGMRSLGSLIHRPHPVLHCLQYGKASGKKLGGRLGTRLILEHEVLRSGNPGSVPCVLGDDRLCCTSSLKQNTTS